MYLYCDGDIIATDTNNISSFQCSTGWTVRDRSAESFDPASDLDPELIAGSIAFGAFFMLPLWAVLMSGKYLFKAIPSRL